MDSVFDVIGLVMVGPSSSHTAAMVKAGHFFREIFQSSPKSVEVRFHGSLAKTGKGHGSHLAVTAGILGMYAHDPRIKNALLIAKKSNLHIEFQEGIKGENIVRIKGKVGTEEHEVSVESVGGGHIRIREIDGFECDFEPDFPLIITFHNDIPGVIAGITAVLSKNHINIGWMIVTRDIKGGKAMAVIKVDNHVTSNTLEKLRNSHGMQRVIYMEGI